MICDVEELRKIKNSFSSWFCLKKSFRGNWKQVYLRVSSNFQAKPRGQISSNFRLTVVCMCTNISLFPRIVYEAQKGASLFKAFWDILILSGQKCSPGMCGDFGLLFSSPLSKPTKCHAFQFWWCVFAGGGGVGVDGVNYHFASPPFRLPPSLLTPFRNIYIYIYIYIYIAKERL